jgi:hypothetical protein
MTNKTAPALQSFGTVTGDLGGYKTRENLYFVFHEGVGQRLKDKTPVSFADARDLRTGLQHDVDHGSTAQIKKKKNAIGAVFKKYSGETSPEVLDPERFKIVQANLLAAVRQDLEGLLSA